MINDLTQGIAQKLRQEFPEEDYKIYTEEVQQDMQTPCFFIFFQKANVKRRVGPRFREKYSFEVQYYPADASDKYETMHDVAQKLYTLLEVVPAGESLVRGRELAVKMERTVLKFTGAYEVFMVEVPEEDEYMQYLSVEHKSKI